MRTVSPYETKSRRARDKNRRLETDKSENKWVECDHEGRVCWDDGATSRTMKTENE